MVDPLPLDEVRAMNHFDFARFSVRNGYTHCYEEDVVLSALKGLTNQLQGAQDNADAYAQAVLNGVQCLILKWFPIINTTHSSHDVPANDYAHECLTTLHEGDCACSLQSTPLSDPVEKSRSSEGMHDEATRVLFADGNDVGVTGKDEAHNLGLVPDSLEKTGICSHKDTIEYMVLNRISGDDAEIIWCKKCGAIKPSNKSDYWEIPSCSQPFGFSCRDKSRMDSAVLEGGEQCGDAGELLDESTRLNAEPTYSDVKDAGESPEFEVNGWPVTDHFCEDCGQHVISKEHERGVNCADNELRKGKED